MEKMYDSYKDLAYWADFYARHKLPFEASSFAAFCLGRMDGGSVLELGCGNGRDSLFFAQNGLNVTAVDLCESEIEFLRAKFSGERLRFLCADFTDLTPREQFDAVYSRFTLHSVDATGEERLFAWIPAALRAGGLLCIEVRGRRNSLFGLGEPVGHGAYIYDGHFRRFVEFGALCERLCGLGFDIEYGAERRGFAAFGGEDDIFIRIIARKLEFAGGGVEL